MISNEGSEYSYSNQLHNMHCACFSEELSLASLTLLWLIKHSPSFITIQFPKSKLLAFVDYQGPGLLSAFGSNVPDRSLSGYPLIQHVGGHILPILLALGNSMNNSSNLMGLIVPLDGGLRVLYETDKDERMILHFSSS